MAQVPMESAGRSFDGEAALDREVYFSGHYLQLPVLIALCEQIVAVANLRPRNVLEIGKGNGIVSDYLKKCGIQVTTFDINPALEPDVLGNVLELDTYFGEGEYEVILCGEVLEHMPFEQAKTAVAKIAAVCGRHSVITLPHCQRARFVFRGEIGIYLGRLGRFSRSFGVLLAQKGKRPHPHHHWEINSGPDTRLEAVRTMFREWFAIRDSSRLKHYPVHRMFLLEKAGHDQAPDR